MKVQVDLERCEGHGLCEDVAPELFEVGDEGDLVVLFTGEVPPGQETRAHEAVRVCPVGALRGAG